MDESERQDSTVSEIPGTIHRAGWGRGNTLVFSIFDDHHHFSVIEAKFDADLHFPLLSKLVHQSADVFSRIQSSFELPDKERGSKILEASRLYRAHLKECSVSYKHAAEKSNEEDPDSAQSLYAQAEVVGKLGLLWHLCELCFLESPQAGALLSKLLLAVQIHFRQVDVLAQQLNEERPVHLHPDYWRTITGFVLHGRMEEALRLLSLHPDEHSEEFKTLAELIRTMPRHSEKYVNFERQWRQWRSVGRRYAETGHFAADPDLETLSRILCGDVETFGQLADQFDSWFDFMVCRLLFCEPTVDLSQLAAQAKDAMSYFDAPPGPWDHLLLDLLSLDIHKFIADCCKYLSNWWLSCHLTDLLYWMNVADFSESSHGFILREFLIIQYAESLVGHPTLWRLALVYFRHGGEQGMAHLRAHLERVPFKNEKEAYCMMDLAVQYHSPDIAHSIAKTMSSRYLQKKGLEAALYWALKTSDTMFISSVVDKILQHKIDTDELPDLGFLDSNKEVVLLSSKLLFLNQYCEFHRLLKQEKIKEAAGCLVEMLAEPNLVPKRFRSTMLFKDAVPLLKRDDVLFTQAQTYELMAALQLVVEARALESKKGEEDDPDLKELRFLLLNNLVRSFEDE